MKKQHLNLAVAGLALIVAAFVLYRQLGGRAASLEQPQVLESRILGDAPVESKIKAAQDLVRHGRSARSEIRRALSEHRRHEPEVVEPLLQATTKTKDYRSLPDVIKLMEHEDPQVRGRAGATARQIMGIDFGFRAGDPPKKRAQIVAAIRNEYQVKRQLLGEVYSYQRE